MNKVLYKMKDGCEKYAPLKLHSNDAGFDLYAIEDVFLYPNKPTYFLIIFVLSSKFKITFEIYLF